MIKMIDQIYCDKYLDRVRSVHEGVAGRLALDRLLIVRRGGTSRRGMYCLYDGIAELF